MNPSAQEFIPGSVSQNTKPRSHLATTKLRAAATPFIPHSTTSNPQPPPPPPPPVQLAGRPDPAQLPPRPAVVPPPASTPAAPEPPATAPAATQAPEVHPSPSQESNQPSGADSLEDELPPATAVNWQESRLPSLFGCHNTSALATKEPIRLHTAWDLYADDHSGTSTPQGHGGGPAAASTYDPIFITSVADVESFWRLWRYVPPPSCCSTPFTYSWFRKDIRPEWEHPRNKKGGTISMVIFDRDRPGLNDKQALDDAFMVTLIGCAGESFADTNTTVNGVVLKLRQNKPVVLQVWTAHSEANKLKAFANGLRDALTKVIGSKSLQKLEYFSHNQIQSGSNSLAARMRPKGKLTPDYTF